MGLNLHYTSGQTPLDYHEKEGLKIKSITTQGELDEFEQLNIERAVEWTIHTKLKPERVLTEAFIKELHKRMFNDIWKWACKFRKSDKNIGVEWPQIGIQLNQLFGDTKYWIDNNTFSQEEIAIRFKHRIVAIHCFSNGNGRHSRMMADIIMENVFGKNAFSWRQSNMSKPDDVRKAYIAALKEADRGNIEPLLGFAKT